MLAGFQATTPLVVALVVALLAITVAFALSRVTPTRIAISPLWPLGAWLAAGGSLLSVSFMLPGAPTWMITTIRVVAGIGACVVLAIMFWVKRGERVALRPESASSSTLPAPYISGRADVLSMPQQAAAVSLPFAA